MVVSVRFRHRDPLLPPPFEGEVNVCRACVRVLVSCPEVSEKFSPQDDGEWQMLEDPELSMDD